MIMAPFSLFSDYIHISQNVFHGTLISKNVNKYYNW